MQNEITSARWSQYSIADTQYQRRQIQQRLIQLQLTQHRLSQNPLHLHPHPHLLKPFRFNQRRRLPKSSAVVVGKPLQVAAEHAGMTVACPACSKSLVVPGTPPRANPVQVQPIQQVNPQPVDYQAAGRFHLARQVHLVPPRIHIPPQQLRFPLLICRHRRVANARLERQHPPGLWLR